jgi:hypothetical protein
MQMGGILVISSELARVEKRDKVEVEMDPTRDIP